jgi:hypothetical protein
MKSAVPASTELESSLEDMHTVEGDIAQCMTLVDRNGVSYS